MYVILSSQCQQILRRKPKILYQSRHYFNTMTMFHARLFMFALFFCCLLGSRSWAQESTRSTVSLTTVNETITDEVPRLPWSVGTDLLWLIDKNSLPSTSIFVRRNVQPENKMPGAIRMRMGFRLDDFSTNLTNADLLEYNDFDILLRLGYELQVQKGNHQFFYGVDMHISYAYRYARRMSFTDSEFGSNQKWISRDHIWNVGPIGFIGYQYFLTPNVSFSIEASLNVNYRRIKEVDINENIVQPEIATATILRNNFTAQFQPFYVLNFHYNF